MKARQRERLLERVAQFGSFLKCLIFKKEPPITQQNKSSEPFEAVRLLAEHDSKAWATSSPKLSPPSANAKFGISSSSY